MLITIGRVLKPWGVKGEVKVEPITDFPERFTMLKRLTLTSPAGESVVSEVTSVRYAGGIPYLLFKGYDTPEQVKAFNGWFLQIPEEEAMPLPEGQYYWFELIGMEVFSEAGEKLGTIVDIFETGSNDVYVMKHGKRETYIPATAEVVKIIDRKEKRMVIHLLDGLMEEK